MNPGADPVTSTARSKAARGAEPEEKINAIATGQEKVKLKSKSPKMNKKKKKKFMKGENLLLHVIPVDLRAKS